MAARRGRGDVLAMLEKRGYLLDLHGVDNLSAACATGDRDAVSFLVVSEPHLSQETIAEGGTLLAEFASNGNVEGLRCLLGLGVSATAPVSYTHLSPMRSHMLTNAASFTAI